MKGAAEASVRVIKVVARGEELVCDSTLPESDSLEEDIKALGESLADAEPCIALVRLKGSERFADTDWAMVSYTPDNAPVKARMLNASSHKTLMDAFSDIKFKEYQVTMKDEVTLAQFYEATKELSDSERRDAMSREERDHDDVKKQLAKEQAAAPKMLAGLVALKIKALESFDEAVKVFKETEEGKAVLARLVGDTNEELDGKVLDDVTSPPSLKGKLPPAEPCYVLFKLSPTRLLFISWLPEGTPVKLRMKCSTFKASVLDHVKEVLPEFESISRSEITDEDDLTEDLGKQSAASEETEAASAKPAFKPPGGYALPGMGVRPPMPGGFALPGMGAK